MEKSDKVSIASKSMKMLLIMAVCLLALTSCAMLDSILTPDSGNNSGLYVDDTGPSEPPESSGPAQTDEPEELPLTGTAYGRLMDALLMDSDYNPCISPLSVKLALAMAYNGAENKTADLLGTIFLASPDRTNEWALALMEQNKVWDGKKVDDSSPPKPDIRIANSFWLKRDYDRAVSGDFKAALRENYFAHYGILDRTPEPINEWVESATRGKISEIVESIDTYTMLFLINAMYFKANWMEEFDKAETEKGEFTNIDGSISTPNMLHGTADAYIDTPYIRGMTKYLSSGFEFTAIMIRSDEDEVLSFDNIIEAKQLADDSFTNIDLTIPKFGFEAGVDFVAGMYPEFDALFVNTGMNGALSENAKIDYMFISAIIHKTTFTLGEAGIEASAATAVDIAAGAAPGEQKNIAIVFDKPFYFVVTDPFGEVLFFGKVTNP